MLGPQCLALRRGGCCACLYQRSFMKQIGAQCFCMFCTAALLLVISKRLVVFSTGGSEWHATHQAWL